MLGRRAIVVAYGVLAVLSCGLAYGVRGSSPFVYPTPWLLLDEPLRSASSILLGVAFAALVVGLTRLAVAHFRWASRLHAELRPITRDIGLGTIVGLAVFSSLGEELVFRALLMPFLGVLAQAILFGLAHQVRGPSRWVWIGWATVVGLCFGVLYALTGSLVGALTSHALINGYNLRYLRDHDPGSTDPSQLGGLLNHSRT